jgi:syntaxin 16
LESEISVNDTIIRERQKELDSVLNQIVELGDMMQEMNSMVVEQGTLLDRIDFNIDVAGQTVKKANNNLDQSERIQ